ncbi:DUF4429 domain-containing protein [Chloroflexota bacterium]
MGNVVMEAKGVNGQLELLEDRIQIKRKGVMGFITPWLEREKEILISQIEAIQLKEAGLSTSGYIQFALIGGQDSKGEFLPATTEGNKVEFNYRQRKSFEQIKEAIDETRRKIAQQTGKEISELDESWKLSNTIDHGVFPGYG